jgi:hypothetical protein
MFYKYKVGDIVRPRDNKNQLGIVIRIIKELVFDYEVVICGEENKINAYWEDEIEKLQE